MKQTIEIISRVNKRQLKVGLDRRQFSYAEYSPERRSGFDRRRKGADLSLYIKRSQEQWPTETNKTSQSWL
ncbi:MAG: hypothetical protein ABIJ59_20595 [Pseudomonadota bacterium]